MKLQENAFDLTPGSERLAAFSFKSLLAPMPMSMLADEADAKDCLKLVLEKVVTRATKRKMEADALRAREEEEKKLAGAKRKAFRKKVATRPVKTKREVDNCLRVSTY